MTNNKCPLCGAPQNWRDLMQSNRQETAWGPWEKRDSMLFGLGDVSALPVGATYQRRRPVRDPHVESDVATPILQALFSGVVGAVSFGAVAGLADWPKPLLISATGGAGVVAVTWFWLLRQHRALLWEVEELAGADLDGDGVVGEPETRRVDVRPEPNRTMVEVTERQPNNVRMRFGEIPLGRTDLEAVARAVLVQRENFSRRGLSEILSQEEYAAFYAAMTKAGLLAHIGNANELTAAGRAFLRQYLDD
jgi:hypothetical protein